MNEMITTSNGYKLIHEGLPDLLPMQGRSPGIHVSQVIHDMCVERGHFGPKGVITPTTMTRMQLGQAFEDVITRRYMESDPGRYMIGGEARLNGISGTKDMVNVGADTLDEIKLTWMGAKQIPGSDKFWKFDTQLKTYCKLNQYRKGRLHVCHINGYYYYMINGATKAQRANDGPIYRIWEKEFTTAELEANWAMIRAHASTMEGR